MTKVIYYTTAGGENPTEKFLDSLSSVQKAKASRIIGYIEEYSLVVAIPHIKKLSGTPLWEIRILGQDNIRILYATFKNNTIIILHGFIKKSQKTPARETNTALNRLSEWTTRKEKGT